MDHVIKFGSRICISKLPIMGWSTFLIIQSKQKIIFIFFINKFQKKKLVGCLFFMKQL